MTTWLKKPRLYLLRRQLRKLIRKPMPKSLVLRNGTIVQSTEMNLYCDQRADLINRIAEIEKSL